MNWLLFKPGIAWKNVRFGNIVFLICQDVKILYEIIALTKW
jgi:hypothetical protein